MLVRVDVNNPQKYFAYKLEEFKQNNPAEAKKFWDFFDAYEPSDKDSPFRWTPYDHLQNDIHRKSTIAQVHPSKVIDRIFDAVTAEELIALFN